MGLYRADTVSPTSRLTSTSRISLPISPHSRYIVPAKPHPRSKLRGGKMETRGLEARAASVVKVDNLRELRRPRREIRPHATEKLLTQVCKLESSLIRNHQRLARGVGRIPTSPHALLA